MILRARLRARCGKCGEIIEVGETIAWMPEPNGHNAEHYPVCPENDSRGEDDADLFAIFHENT